MLRRCWLRLIDACEDVYAKLYYWRAADPRPEYIRPVETLTPRAKPASPNDGRG
jgi:hypothetical protein